MTTVEHFLFFHISYRELDSTRSPVQEYSLDLSSSLAKLHFACNLKYVEVCPLLAKVNNGAWFGAPNSRMLS